MKIEILDEADDDLQQGREFCERCEAGIGDYFSASLVADFDSLRLFAGVHPRLCPAAIGLCRTGFLSPFNYRIEKEIVRVYAVLDLRRDPAWIRRRLGSR